MKKILKTVSILITIAIVVSTMAFPALASSSDTVYVVGNSSYDLQTGIVHIRTQNGPGNEIPYFYSDGYFMEDSKEYNKHLATFSVMLNLMVGWNNDSKAKSLLTDLGFGNYYANNELMTGSDSEDSIGFCIASKPIYTADGTSTGKTVIAIGIRGIFYANEWANNFLLGSLGEAKGFSDQATKIKNQLDTYILDNGLSTARANGNLIFYVVGYSRSAAVANILSQRIIDNDYATKGNKVFAYTVATPKGGQSSFLNSNNTELYKSIHNIVNYDDVVTHAAPSEYGFIRYGTDYSIDNIVNTDEAKSWLNYLTDGYEYNNIFHGAYLDVSLAQIIADLVKEGLTIDDFISPYNTTLTQGQYIDDALRNIAGNWLSNRSSDYVNRTFNGSITFEKALCNALYIYSNTSSEQISEIFELLSGREDELRSLFTKNSLVVTYDFPNWNDTYFNVLKWEEEPRVSTSTKVSDITLFWDFLNTKVDGRGIEEILGPDLYTRLKNSFYVLADVGISIASYDYNQDYNSISVSSNKLYLVATMIYNFVNDKGNLVNYHYTDFYVASVLADDDFYDKNINIYVNNELVAATLVQNPNVLVSSYDDKGRMMSVVSKDSTSTERNFYYTVDNSLEYKVYFLDNNFVPYR